MMKNKLLIISLLTIVVLSSQCHTAKEAQNIVIYQTKDWFDPNLVGSIVLLGKKVDERYIPHATGFLIYNHDQIDNPILVTCSHVLKRKDIYVTILADSEYIQSAQERGTRSIFLSRNTWELDGEKLRTKIILDKGRTYATHPNGLIDIAAFPIGLGTTASLEKGKDPIKIAKVAGITKSQLQYRTDTDLGEDVYFAGYPAIIAIYGVLQPIIRSGSIAWAPDNCATFLLDAIAIGGNSGSPIFTKKLEAGQRSFLVGMVSGYIGSNGNVGLVNCVWSDDIMLVVEEAKKL